MRKASFSEVSYDLRRSEFGGVSVSIARPPKELELEIALRTKPLYLKEQHKTRIREPQEGCGEAMLQMRALRTYSD